VSSLAAKKQRPLRFKEGRRGQSSSSSDDEVLEKKLKQSLLIMDLRLDEIKEHVDAMERKLKNLRNNVVKVAEDIGNLLEFVFDEPII